VDWEVTMCVVKYNSYKSVFSFGIWKINPQHENATDNKINAQKPKFKCLVPKN
jgi:hypothetical protein